jgi:hypothetical protein
VRSISTCVVVLASPSSTEYGTISHRRWTTQIIQVVHPFQSFHRGRVLPDRCAPWEVPASLLAFQIFPLLQHPRKLQSLFLHLCPITHPLSQSRSHILQRAKLIEHPQQSGKQCVLRRAEIVWNDDAVVGTVEAGLRTSHTGRVGYDQNEVAEKVL